MNFYLKESLNNISCLLKIMFVCTTIQSKIVRTKKRGEHVNPIIHIYVDFYVSYSKFCNVHSFSKYKDR